MGTSALSGRDASEDELGGRPTEPNPISIPPDAFPSLAPPASEREPPTLRSFRRRESNPSIHEAKTIPPPAERERNAMPRSAIKPPVLDGLTEIDDAWD